MALTSQRQNRRMSAKDHFVPLTPADIIEAIVDELAVEVGEPFVTVNIERAGPGTLLLNYGDGGQFRLDVIEVSD
ncbi:hypothetical protein [Nocardioides sp.]|uniref:hypothetical protein n=1 Tax=Nocardioides sp. TaxID=35761 RepID=UPI002736E799|nr:hypothetical protein [Nocardioides sp.]MDP3889663.1 hypothetical protein [Nocardioides sp.]